MHEACQIWRAMTLASVLGAASMTTDADRTVHPPPGASYRPGTAGQPPAGSASHVGPSIRLGHRLRGRHCWPGDFGRAPPAIPGRWARRAESCVGPPSVEGRLALIAKAPRKVGSEQAVA